MTAETNGPGMDWSVCAAIARQAAEHADQPALVSPTGALSYGQLMDRAHALARWLEAHGVAAEVTVASCLPRDLALAPAIIGTWLARGAYVPLDPDGPSDRRSYMLRDSAARVVIATPTTVGLVPQGSADVMLIDETGLLLDDVAGHPDSRSRPSSLDDLAYVIYTSGSTGRPKGVLIEQGSLAAMAQSHEAVLYSGQRREPQHVALNNQVAADAFFSDFVHLAYGRVLHVVSSRTRRDPDQLADFITEYGIEVMDATPTQLQTVLLAGRGDALAQLDVLVVGGEPASPQLWQQLSALPHVRPYNFYGPTETTVDVTVAAFGDHVSPRLGSPLPGCSVWVADDQLRPLPIGMEGELLIAGRQVARGYLNAEPTDEAKFVTVESPGGEGTVRAYRTGDRGRRDAEGHLEFLGRTDDQVSIAGHRVELGEVETALRGCHGVRAAATGIQRHQYEASLVSYVVLTPGLTVADVRAQLATIVPRHMIPAITVVDEIPLGATGKADLPQLLASLRPVPATAMVTAVPGRSINDQVAAIWRDVLGIAEVQPEDDFFQLGGDSVKATTAIVSLRNDLASDIPIRVLFKNPVFEDFCSAITAYVRHTGE